MNEEMKPSDSGSFDHLWTYNYPSPSKCSKCGIVKPSEPGSEESGGEKKINNFNINQPGHPIPDTFGEQQPAAQKCELGDSCMTIHNESVKPCSHGKDGKWVCCESYRYKLRITDLERQLKEANGALRGFKALCEGKQKALESANDLAESLLQQLAQEKQRNEEPWLRKLANAEKVKAELQQQLAQEKQRNDLLEKDAIINSSTQVFLREDVSRLQAELEESARLHGMGSSREAALLGKVERLERENEKLKEENKQLLEICQGKKPAKAAKILQDRAQQETKG